MSTKKRELEEVVDSDDVQCTETDEPDEPDREKAKLDSGEGVISLKKYQQKKARINAKYDAKIAKLKQKIAHLKHKKYAKLKKLSGKYGDKRCYRCDRLSNAEMIDCMACDETICHKCSVECQQCHESGCRDKCVVNGGYGCRDNLCKSCAEDGDRYSFGESD